MFYADYHTHSTCSPDGHNTITEQALAAVSAGMSAMCITDHADLLDYEGNPCLTLDWAPIRKEFALAQKAVGNRLELRLGIELGEPQTDAAAAQKILDDAPELDFILGSYHNLSPEKGGRDLYFLDFGTPEKCYQVLDDYFASLLTLSAMPHWDVFSHIIYPLRYMVLREKQPVTLDRYHDTIRTILQRVISSGRGIELNTYSGKTVEDWREVLAMYRALGGEIITIGSDAHVKENVGRGIPEGAALLKELGFRYFAVYRHRRPEMLPLE